MARSMRSCVLALVTLMIAACGTGPSISRVPGVPAPDARAATSESATATTDETDGDDDDDAMEDADDPSLVAEPCQPGMVLVDGAFCIDKYEAALVELLPDGTEKPYPHYLSVDGHSVRAVSEAGLYPQGYISETQAQDACAASGKRLCSYPEWKTACMGPKQTTYPYGDTRRSGVCHDGGRSAVVAVFGAKAVAASPVSAVIAAANAPKRSRPAHVTTKRRASQVTKARAGKRDKAVIAKKNVKARRRDTARNETKKTAARTARASTRPTGIEFNVWTQLNDARLGQVEGALSRTGEHPECANDWGVVDMVGNLHEWVATDASAAHGTFAGGYYLDTSQNGDGCNYKTQAHAHDYHDYSTGFRCCSEPVAGD